MGHSYLLVMKGLGYQKPQWMIREGESQTIEGPPGLGPESKLGQDRHM